MRAVIRLAWLAVMATAATCAQAECVLSGATILNPEDPDCRDARFRYTELATGAPDEVALGYPVPLPIDSLTPVDGFRSLESLIARHLELALTRDNVQASQIGSSVLGEPIRAFEIGDADALTVDGLPEPAVLVNGTIHAREWQSPEVVTGLFESLAGKDGDGHLGSYLNENLNIVLIPILNVDGLAQTQRYPDRFGADPRQPRDGRMRRKNMTRGAGAVDTDLDSGDDSFFGVDLNRNNLHGFGLNGGSSADPVSLVYRGPTPASTPEILALQAAVALAPAERLRLYIDVHSFSQIYLPPLTGNPRRDGITLELMTRMRAVTGFRYRDGRPPPDQAGYQGIGTTADYFAYEYQIPAWTLEIEPLDGAQQYGGTASHGHSGFILPDVEIARVRRELTATHELGFYRQAGPPRIVACDIRNAATGEQVFRADWLATVQGRSLAVSVDRALIPGQTYRLWVAFDKPMRWRDASGNVTAYPGQTVDGQSGRIRLTFPTQDARSVDLPVDDPGVWLSAPGGAPEGFLRYRDDALAVEFTLPSGLDTSAPVAAVLEVDNPDLSGLRLDADPATPVGWAGGHWIGYESTTGLAGDTGGTDCSMRPFAAASDTATPPPARPGCSLSNAPAPSGSSSGGGGGGWLWPSLLLGLLRMRRLAR